MLFGLGIPAANADDGYAFEYRAMEGVGEFNSTWQFALATNFRAPVFLRADHLEAAVGVITSGTDQRPFISLGPTWHFPIGQSNAFVDLGFSPTIVSGSNFSGADLGGNFHFTSSAGVGAILGTHDDVVVSLRIQHTSNGGLHGTNPGLDMAGLTFSYKFDN